MLNTYFFVRICSVDSSRESVQRRMKIRKNWLLKVKMVKVVLVEMKMVRVVLEVKMMRVEPTKAVPMMALWSHLEHHCN